jgi:hypothetical protein
MAGFAIGGEEPYVKIRFGVAGAARSWRSLEGLPLMAGCAGHGNMGSGERKGCQAVIYLGILPTVGGVAAAAVVTKFPGMGIVLSMAVDAILRRSGEDLTDVAILAGDIRMKSHQWKTRLVVIDLGVLPIIWRVASAAVSAKPSCVGVIPGMAPEAIRRSPLQRHQIASSSMAGFASQAGVTPF